MHAGFSSKWHVSHAFIRSAARKDHRDVNIISDVLPFGRLLDGEPNAISYAKFFSRSHHAVIRVYDAAGNVIETHKHAGDFKKP
jgi:hypothetical protein